ncbi:uncharacterized protein BXZ73DRAFT_79949 [Epithele typhae]|uniref:uncharacterized protein n=1 Tax=Epithele typhae TaxID=378194 RepID=UPI0020089464|nr:uncharacterized protein BXZ73DRAFT_79949 [Epithele typhae]KAH9921566.1 hypothetical protein BXZ73DRAFT_79949 [Epithele typhae]
MRVKLEILAPLPPLKAWYSPSALSTVRDLKNSLCAELQPLQDAGILPDELVLLLDDFEILDSSQIDVVRDGDLIVIKKSFANSHPKRKAVSQADGPARKRTKTQVETLSHATRRPAPTTQKALRPPSPSTKSSSSDSSDSDLDSDSESSSQSSDSEDSSSSSSSSEDSSSESDSSESLRPTTPASKKTKAAGSGQPKAATSTCEQPHVPPGFGKPSTHSRNIRRRRKKMVERIASTVEPASVNDIPLGPRAPPVAGSSSSATPIEAQELFVQGSSKKQTNGTDGQTAEAPLFMMASLQNKNKRRGFKAALSKGVPAKINFLEAEEMEILQNATMESDAMVVEATLQVVSPPPSSKTKSHVPRLVPPSEKQELGQIPSNMFVTSVDVEEGMWPLRRKNKKKMKPKAQDVWEEEEGPSFANGLPYDDDAAMVIEQAVVAREAAKVSSDAQASEYAAVATHWDSLRRINGKEQLVAGVTVAWRALGINQVTLTPEMLLHVGHVEECADNVVVKMVMDAGAGAVSFGAVSEVDEPVEEVFEWTDVLQGDWRLVTIV